MSPLIAGSAFVWGEHERRRVPLARNRQPVRGAPRRAARDRHRPPGRRFSPRRPRTAERVFASARARLLALKPEIIAHLRREAGAASDAYARDERAWSARFVGHLARAFGYGDELAYLAAEAVAKRPTGAPFTVGADVISIAMGEGREIRIHRLPQPWAGPLPA